MIVNIQSRSAKLIQSADHLTKTKSKKTEEPIL